MQKKTQNVALLESTKDDCDLYTLLSNGIAATREQQVVISEKETIEYEMPEKCNVIVSAQDCFTAAAAYRGKKTIVLNVSSSTVQAGDATHGGNDSESIMCRTSTLYKCLAYQKLWKDYYLPHKTNNTLYTSDVIYSPNIIVFKSELNPTELLPDEDWFSVDVLTSSLPSFKKSEKSPKSFKYQNADDEISADELEKLIYNHYVRLFQIARKKQAQVLIIPEPSKLCKIDNDLLVKAVKKAVWDFGSLFETIEIAIPAEDPGKSKLQAFQKAFDFLTNPDEDRA